MSISFLIERQNPDGGWPYIRGASWTEPTAYAVMALWAGGEREAAARGARWLRSSQRADGGWAPQPCVDQSAWVTAPVALVAPELLGEAAHARAIEWLLVARGEESAPVYRLRQWLLGNEVASVELAGWPWAPGAAAWVGPTALAVLALDKALARRPSRAIRERLERGRRFLLARACREGGWNHGAPRALGREAGPYPETTGMGLLATRGVRSAEIDRAIARAYAFLDECRSADALNWLRLGLLAHGRMPAGYCPPQSIERRTLPENSLHLLVASAEKGAAALWC